MPAPLPSIAIVKRPPLCKGIYPPRLPLQLALSTKQKAQEKEGKARRRKARKDEAVKTNQHHAVNTMQAYLYWYLSLHSLSKAALVCM